MPSPNPASPFPAPLFLGGWTSLFPFCRLYSGDGCFRVCQHQDLPPSRGTLARPSALPAMSPSHTVATSPTSALTSSSFPPDCTTNAPPLTFPPSRRLPSTPALLISASHAPGSSGSFLSPLPLPLAADLFNHHPSAWSSPKGLALWQNADHAGQSRHEPVLLPLLPDPLGLVVVPPSSLSFLCQLVIYDSASLISEPHRHDVPHLRGVLHAPSHEPCLTVVQAHAHILNSRHPVHFVRCSLLDRARRSFESLILQPAEFSLSVFFAPSIPVPPPRCCGLSAPSAFLALAIRDFQCMSKSRGSSKMTPSHFIHLQSALFFVLLFLRCRTSSLSVSNGNLHTPGQSS